jgi:predicted aldo/keto reductase-like oxidoreductase
MIGFARERYAAMDPADHWVPGAHARDFADDPVIAALPDSPFKEQIPRLLREAHALLTEHSS